MQGKMLDEKLCMKRRRLEKDKGKIVAVEQGKSLTKESYMWFGYAEGKGRLFDPNLFISQGNFASILGFHLLRSTGLTL